MPRFISHRRPEETLLEPVQTVADLRLVGVGEAEDKAMILCEDTGIVYRYDFQSSAVDNGADIIEPTGGAGAWLATGGATGVIDHNDTGNIQGGTADEYYHLTEDEHTEVEAGIADGGFRLKWSQEQIYTADDTGVVSTDEELLLEKLTVDGDLVVDGTLTILSPKKDPALWRRRWSQENTVGVAEQDIVPPGAHLLVIDSLTVDGDLDVQGDVFIIPSSVVRQRSMYVSSQKFMPVDGFPWVLNYDNVANVFELDRTPANDTGVVVVDFPVEASDGGLGVRPTAMVLYYSISTNVGDDVVATLFRVNGPGVDTVGAGAKPAATSVPVTIANVQHDTAGERAAIEDHALEYTVDSPDWLSSRETMRMLATFDAQLTTDITVRGALLHYDDIVWP